MKTTRTIAIASAILLLTGTLGLNTRTVPVAFAATETFTVNTVDDLQICKFRGPISLRCAIKAANAKPVGDTKIIKFGIAGCPSGVCKITVLQQGLPAITTNNVVIDGYTQTGATPNSIDLHKPGGDNAIINVQVDGTRVPGANGLVIEGSNNTIRGLSVTNFMQSVFAATGGVGIGTTVPPAKGLPVLVTRNKIVGNFIGLQPDGVHLGPNAYGVAITGSRFQGIKVGTGQIVGTAAAADRNVISGNTRFGVYLSGSNLNKILGNFIGTDRTASGSAANRTGIYLTNEGTTSSGDTIGTPGTGGNVISGNTTWGIFGAFPLTAAKVSGNFTLLPFNFQIGIRGNFIGTNNAGTGAVPNGGGGVFSFHGVGWTIGGATAADGNIVSSNGGDGIHLAGAGGNNTISLNTIGVSSSLGPLPNKGNGVDLDGAGQNNTLNTATVANNTIASNLLFGVQVGSTDTDNTHNVITQNSMFANKLGGISLFHQPPDQCIFGPFGGLNTSNDYMGCPLIKSATPQTGVSGEACANCTVEVFIAPNGTDDEGKTLLGSVTAGDCPHATQPSCWGTWTLPPGNFSVPLSAGQFVTATATSTAATIAVPGSPPTPFTVETSQFSRDARVGRQLIVNTTGDKQSPCAAAAYSLRCAITQANADTAGDEIDFAIPKNSDPGCSGGVCTLGVSSALPALTADSTSIKGYTQPGASPSTQGLLSGDNALIRLLLKGSGHPTPGDGIGLQGMWDDVEGMSIQAFRDPNAGAAVHITGHRAMWDMVMGDWAGLDPGGDTTQKLTANNQQGVAVDGGAMHALIGFRVIGDPNVLSGNQNYGFFNEEGGNSCETGNPNVFLFCNNMVLGNFIGTDPTGTAARGNGVSGVFIYGSHHNVIGAAGGQLGNIVGGNLSDGVDDIGSNFNWIAGNNIGNSVSGSGAVANGVAGIFLYGGKGNLVGGPNPFFLNAVGGNGADGIDALAEPGIVIANNIVGTFHQGIQSEPNGSDGIFVGNTTTLAAPELQKHHVPARIVGRVAPAIVGYHTMQGLVANNSVFGNGLNGIQLGQTESDKDLHIVVSQNPMADNAGAGILFTGSGVNQCGSLPQSFPNDGLACPFINSATSQGQQAFVTGFACPGCLVEVFAASGAGQDHGGFGEGARYLGTTTAAGNGSWTIELDTPGPIVNPGEYVTATATRAGGAFLPETSEFAFNRQVASIS